MAFGFNSSLVGYYISRFKRSSLTLSFLWPVFHFGSYPPFWFPFYTAVGSLSLLDVPYSSVSVPFPFWAGVVLFPFFLSLSFALGGE